LIKGYEWVVVSHVTSVHAIRSGLVTLDASCI
jgi:hypothetical protein